jgi:HD-like signal output (HDOD) protein
VKNIVFVDDERDLLDGLRARLYKHRGSWNMQFVESGEAALAIFDKEHVDLIVSDVRMPGMDGGQLLTTVKQKWPDTIRIIVSGYSDPAQAVRLASLAHQYLAKPCEDRQVENVIERCFNLHDLLSQESLRNVVGRITKLPAMPKTYARLQQALAQPDVTAAMVGDIVNSDTAIASKVLQITNSAFFRLRKPMVRVKDAVTYLGFATVRNLVLCAEISSEWKTSPDLVHIDPQDLQRHAQYSASACKALAGGPVAPDDAWLAGLVHDIGYWVLIQECPRELAQAMELSRSSGQPLYKCELETIGASHAQMGAYLLGLWGLPYPIVEAVAMHHTPEAVAWDGYDLLRALVVSHSLLPPNAAHAVPLSHADMGVGESYFATLNAPYDWDEARQRVHKSAVPTD